MTKLELEIVMRERYFCRSRLVQYAVLLIVAAASANAAAAPLLRCKIEQGGSTQVLEFAPESSPYTARAVDINGRFRFKAVMVGDAQQVEYVKLYTYDFPKRQPVLLHEAKYMAPTAGSSPQPASLTGVNFVYSPRLERELQYECALLEITP